MTRIFLTPDQAESCLYDGEKIHTHRNPRAGVMLGCDWSRKNIIDALHENSDKIEIGGETCMRLGHGLIVWTSDDSPLFIEADSGKLKNIEEQLTIKS